MLAGGLIVALGLGMKLTEGMSKESRIYAPPNGTGGGQADFPKGSGWEAIAERYTPIKDIAEWEKLVRKQHWKVGNSAHSTASSWLNANPDLPREIQALFGGSAELLAAIPEHVTPLAGRGRGSTSDVFAFVRAKGKICAVTVEGKADENFGDDTVKEWLDKGSSNRVERLKDISKHLGLMYPPPDHIRYQLLHRAASAVIEAKHFNADCAAMVVHSFAPEQTHFKGYGAFLGLFGIRAVESGKLYGRQTPGFPLSFGWASPQVEIATSVATKIRAFPADMGVIMMGGLIFAIGLFWSICKKMNKAPVSVAMKRTDASTEATATTAPDNKKHETKVAESKTNDDVSYQKGEEFEKYVVDIFAKREKHFEHVGWSSDKMSSTGNRAADATHPDLKYLLNTASGKYHFAVECKYRDGLFGGKIKIAEPYQLKNYKDYERRTKQATFIVLGTGGKPTNPENIFIIPVRDLTTTQLSEEQLKDYRQQYKSNFFFDTREKSLRLE